MAARGIKQPHPLGSVRSRSGVSPLTAESGIVTSLGVKISALPAAITANDTDQFEVNQAGTSRRITVDQLFAGGTAADWADITGKPATFPPTVPIAWDDISGEPSTFPPTIPTGGGIAAWPYLALTGGTLSGSLAGTTATFSGNVLAPGAQIQMVSTQTGAMTTGTTTIPLDDTIPQITEGNEYMTLSVTPKSATSKLVIDVVWLGSFSAGGVFVMSAALFQDAVANALAASWAPSPAAGAMIFLKFSHTMTSGTTSAITFRVRAGANTAGTTTFNGFSGGRLLGGVAASSIVMREVAV